MTEHNKCFSPSPQSLPPPSPVVLKPGCFFSLWFLCWFMWKMLEKNGARAACKTETHFPLTSTQKPAQLQLFTVICPVLLNERERAAYLPRPARGQPNYGEGGQIDFLLELGKWAAIKHVIPSSLRRLWPFLYTFHNLNAQNGVLQVCANIYCRQQETWQIWQSI